MASTKRTMVIPTAIFLAAVFHLSTPICPKYHPATELLQKTSGSLTHSDYFKVKRWCQWSFPSFKVIDHVILMKLTSISLYKSGCLGSLRLTGLSSFCAKPTNSCFIYSSQPSCDRQMTFDLIRKENCSNTYWVFDDAANRNVRFLSTQKAQKSFTFEYKYFSCKKDYMSKSAVVSNNSDGDAMQNFTSAGNETSQPNSGVPSGTFAGVIVLFVLLLAACLVLMFLLYRRLRRLKSGSRVPRVQYELAKPRDITVLHLSQAEQSDVHTNGGSSFALHGEHHHDPRQNDAIHLQEKSAECSYSYSVDANYGDDTTRSYNSFTSDESEHSVPENTASAYATVDKRRAPTTG